MFNTDPPLNLMLRGFVLYVLRYVHRLFKAKNHVLRHMHVLFDGSKEHATCKYFGIALYLYDCSTCMVL